jgi:2-desacetyl-2-hydroxyethyl bacteriochlorophyllide A dehydrogenase
MTANGVPGVVSGPEGRPVETSAAAPETSIVIRAFNEERWLPEVLAAIDRQTYRSFEVLLVDSGSLDRTRDIAAAHGARIIRLRSEDFTFGHSLNLGIQEARGSLVAIISAHAIPTDEQWLERLVTPLRGADTAMVFGGQRGHAVSKFSEARDFERVFPPRPLVMDDDHVFVNNANSAIRRDLWNQHPFDEGLPGLEDAEWAKYWIPLGKKVLYEPAACIYHVHTESWAQIRHRFHREGIAGRWTAVRIVRHIPGEILRELYWCLLDLGLATVKRCLPSLCGEILRYRYNKTVGIVKGILDSRVITNPSKRAELHFDKGFAAVVIRGSHSAAIEPRAIPALKPSEILVRVAYEGVCATDLEILEGRLGYYKSGLAKYPIVPGHEVSGTVVSLGKKVATLKEGERVVVECIQGCGACDHCGRDSAITCKERREVGVIGVDGGYAEFLVTRARYAHRVPSDVTLAQAALTEPLAVVIKALRRLRAAAPSATPKRCGVIGAGTIGHLAAKVLALHGHDVTVFDREPARLASLNGVVRTEPALTALDRFEWLVEATGDQAALATVMQQSATGATVLLLGLPYGQHSFNFESIVAFDRAVVGSVGSGGADFEEALRTLARIDTGPLLGCIHPLEEFTHAWNAARSRAHMKVMLRIDASAV